MSQWWARPDAFAPRHFMKRAELHDGDYAVPCGCEPCGLIFILLAYMFEAMDPTDRALRLPGDIYPVTELTR